jgi:hypothetical protein
VERYRSTFEMLDAVEPLPSGPVSLSPEYVEAVRQVELRADNQDGSDKTWVGATLRRNRDHFAGAVRLR